MKNFILKLKHKRLIRLSVIALIVVAGLFITLFLSFKEPDTYEEFNKNVSSSDVTTKDVYYLVGPFAEYEKDNVIIERLYIAVAESEFFVLSTGRNNNTGIPVYGEDITGYEVDSVEPVAIKGRGEVIEYDAKDLLLEFYNGGAEDGLTEADSYSLFGAYYLNTNNTGNTDLPMILFCAILAIVILIVFAIIEFRNGKSLMKGLKVYEENGKLIECESDFLNSKDNYNKKLKVLLSRRYLYNFKTNLWIVPLDEIINVYGSCIINGKIQNQEYIAIETKNDFTYYIAPKAREKKNNVVDDFREQLKKIAEENSTYDSNL